MRQSATWVVRNMSDSRQYNKRTVSAQKARAQRTSVREKGKRQRTYTRYTNQSAGYSSSKSKRSETVFDMGSIVKAAKRKDASVGSVAAAIGESIFTSKVALIIIGVVLALLLAGLGDALINGGKAYGNVTIGGLDVSGMDKDQIVQALHEKYEGHFSDKSLTVYGNQEAYDDAMAAAASDDSDDEDEDDYGWDYEEEYAESTYWTVTPESLGATIDYEQYAERALEAGRGAGPFSRIGLLISPVEIPVTVSFDPEAFEDLCEDIDDVIDDPRKDATVDVEDGEAFAVEGHDGTIADRAILTQMLSDEFLGANSDAYIIAASTTDPSRTTYEQAVQGAEQVNCAIRDGVHFEYNGDEWDAWRELVGDWVETRVVELSDGSYGFEFSLDADDVTYALMHNVNAQVLADDITVTFEVDGSDVYVLTSGEAEIPDVGGAVHDLREALFGIDGKAFKPADEDIPISIEVKDSSAPEKMTLGQAIDLGIVTVIGEYETWFSDEPGTENRNHNIKLAADIINNSIIRANGGVWSFHESAGDTNQDPPFASAGSIVEGEVVDSIGGGICQVATTVFNAVYEAGLDINTRWNHTMYISSYPTGRDATVSYPDLDLVWTNDLPSDVLLQMSYTDTTITATLYSVNPGYTVESIEGEWEDGDKYETAFIHDDTLDDGESYLKTSGVDGSKISVTRIVYDKNNNIVRENVYQSNYPSRDEVYVVGPNTDTKKLERDYKDDKKSSDDEG